MLDHSLISEYGQNYLYWFRNVANNIWKKMEAKIFVFCPRALIMFEYSQLIVWYIK